MDVFTEPRRRVDGVPVPYDCHAQKHPGTGLMAQAHVHGYIEILYGLEGQYELQLNGKCIPFSTGDMVLINTREVHKVTALAEGMNSYIVIKFEPELIQSADSTVFELKYLLPFHLPNLNLPRVFPRDTLSDCEVPGLVRDILQESTRKAYGYELAIRSNICRLTLWILRHWHAQGTDSPGAFALSARDMARLKIVFDHVEGHYAQDVRTEECARLCGMSASRFSRFFRQCMHRTFSEYLIYVRVKKAEALLTSTEMNITEIAMETGFSTSSYFIQRFRALNSVTPGDFRKRFSHQV